MDIEKLDIERARELADIIEQILDNRTHVRKHLGEDVVVKGSLSKALQLPSIKRDLARIKPELQQKGLEKLSILWESLSESTRKEAMKKTGMYDPDELDWDDPRSNRRDI